jgi:regulator of protease activity HflC (stomatin/prohibitin superfamily)
VVDIRVKTLDLLGYEAITKDNIRLFLDVVVYAKVMDPYKAVLEVKDVNTAILTFLKSITRETVGNLTAEEVISNIAKVNELLTGERDRLKKEWGVDLISVEIQEITLPGDVQKSMHDLRSAEYQRQVVEQQAFAREALINAIQRAASKLENPALSYMYLEAMKKIADGKATKLIFPMELTRLAESVSKNFGADKDKFLNDIMKAYQETVAKDMKK